MSAMQFERDAIAHWYARQHLYTDPGIRTVFYLPGNAPDREIRLIEVNDLMGESDGDTLEPVNFGVDVGKDVEHALFVLDVTPGQWERIQHGDLELPSGWSLENCKSYDLRQAETTT
jgi:hypothetical protein